MSIEDAVIDRLLGGAYGQIVACNIVASVRERLVSNAMVADLFQALCAYERLEEFTVSASVVGVVLEIRDGDWPKVDPGGTVGNMQLNGEPAEPGDLVGDVSVVMAVSALRWLLGDEGVKRAMAKGLKMAASTTDPEWAADVALWARLEPVERRFQIDPNATLGRRGEVLWFVRRGDLAAGLAAKTAKPQFGQRARDLLGLDRPAGQILVAAHFPAAWLGALARPTFFDGLRHPRFRAWPDGPAAQRDRSWGRTVDLQAFANGAESIDGSPERVATPVHAHTLPTGAMVEVEMLGRVERATGSGDAADAEFAERLAEGLTTRDLAARLKEIISDGSGTGSA